MRRKVPGLRQLRATDDAGAHLRRMFLWQLPEQVCRVRWRGECDPADTVGVSSTDLDWLVYRVYPMRSTASNVRGSRKTETAVRRLSTWVVRGQICSTRRRVSEIINEIIFRAGFK